MCSTDTASRTSASQRARVTKTFVCASRMLPWRSARLRRVWLCDAERASCEDRHSCRWLGSSAKRSRSVAPADPPASASIETLWPTLFAPPRATDASEAEAAPADWIVAMTQRM